MKNNFIYVPSINLYVAKERTLFDHDFYQTQEKLHSKNQRMPTIPEFIEFLKYTKKNYSKIYKEITEVKSSWRTEWLDADFKVKGKDLYVNYHIFGANGKIIKKSEKLDKNTLMKQHKRISLDHWLEDPTKQGLPKKSIESGNLHYSALMKDNNSVARFYADSGRAGLVLYWDLSYGFPYLGVRVVEKK